ncbi:hypothetical protein PR048_032003 [Dryococelus australis]|uniref:DUF4371 domain-containing protein n=1 Tax=Dryococelus australis TaxID=614101 RepID=A0ABQ9G6W8_9NEOP|nr:hypothetical protein PR048_032003 [Dryococelus australis]
MKKIAKSCHMTDFIKFKTSSSAAPKNNDEETPEDVAKYWREVLRILISVIVFISVRRLAFRTKNQTLGSQRNCNYLGLLKLIAEYDNFLSNRIKKHGYSGIGHTKYLSSTICEEVMQLIGEQVFNEVYISNQVVKVLCHNDEGHVDQLTFIFRYLEEHIPVEIFVTCMPNQGYKAKEMFQGLSKFLKKDDINIKNCHGQSCDNTSSMSWKYNGLQALVLAENNLGVWVPCTGHSLNPVVQAAAECCLIAEKDKEESGISCVTALSLHNKMSMMEMGLCTLFWDDILGQVNETSENLQNHRVDMNTGTLALASLTSFIRTTWKIFEEYEVKSAELSDCT